MVSKKAAAPAAETQVADDSKSVAGGEVGRLLDQAPARAAAGMIYLQMSRVLADVGAIGKDRAATTTGGRQMYAFRGIDDMYNALHEILAKHRVFCLPSVVSDRTEDRVSNSGNPLIYRILTIHYDFFAEDGSSVRATLIGEGMDSGDKASNKAMSAAQKYAFLQAFAIPTEETKDSEADADVNGGTAPRFDKENERHVDNVMRELKRANVPPKLHGEIFAKLHGGAATDNRMHEIIAEVTKAAAAATPAAKTAAAAQAKVAASAPIFNADDQKHLDWVERQCEAAGIIGADQTTIVERMRGKSATGAVLKKVIDDFQADLKASFDADAPTYEPTGEDGLGESGPRTAPPPA